MSESKSKKKQPKKEQAHLTQEQVKQPTLRKKLSPISTEVDVDQLKRLHARLNEIFPEAEQIPDFDLDPEDIAVVYDVKVFSKDGQEFRVKGSSVLSGFLLEECIPESPFRFHAFQVTNIYQPLRSKANRYLQRRIPEEDGRRLLMDAQAPQLAVGEGMAPDNAQIENDLSSHGAPPPTGVPTAGEA